MLLLLLTASSLAQEQDHLLPLFDELSAADIDHNIFYYADTQGNQNALSLNANDNLFVPLPQKRFTFNVHTHWYRLDLSNPYQDDRRWLISMGIATAPLLRAYWWEAGELTELKLINDQTLGSERKFSYSSIVAPLELRPGQQGRLFIEYQSLANFPLQIAPFSAEELLSRNLKYALLNGLCIGSALVFCLLFIVQAFIRPSKVLIFYALYISAILLFLVQIFGYGMQFLWPQYGHHNSYITFLISGLIYLFYFCFTINLFNLKQGNKLLYRISLSTCIAIVFTLLVGSFFRLDYLLSVIIVFSLPWPVVCAVWALQNKHPSASFFMVGSFIHCCSTYLLIITCLGLDLGFNVFGIASVGQLIDIACFAAAIFYQNNQTRLQLHDQIQERQADMELLALSEFEQEQAMNLSKSATLELATTTHDLAQPLSSIRLGLAAMDKRDPQVSRLLHTAHYANDLLASVLKSSSSQYKNLPENLDVKLLIRELEQRYQPLFKSKNLGFKCQVQAARLHCSPLVIQRVLDNLLANASKHTKQGRVLLTGRKKSNGYWIQVWDSGEGMNAQQVKTLLLPFKQMKESDAVNSGMGLGLFIVKTLCDQSDLGFDIRTKVGRGTCVSVVIKDFEQDWAA